MRQFQSINQSNNWWQQDKFSITIMKNSIHEILSTVAENNNLTVAETTSEANGYPSNTSFSIIGFESPEQFHAVEQELNELLCLHKDTEGNEEDEFLTVYSQDLHRRDGWQLWHREGHAVNDTYDMYDIYASKGNYCVYNYGVCTEKHFLEEEFNPFIDEYYTIDDVRNRLDLVEKIWNEIDSMEEGQIAVRDMDSNDIEIIDRYSMSYSYDTHNYTKAITIE